MPGCPQCGMQRCSLPCMWVHGSGDVGLQEEEWPSTMCVSTHRDEHGVEHMGLLCMVFLKLHISVPLEAHGVHDTHFTTPGLWHCVKTGVAYFTPPGI